MRRVATVLSVLFLLFTAAPASALVYENYTGYQEVREGQEFDFYFDLVHYNNGWTNSSLSQSDDAAVGWDNVPLISAFVDIDLYSADNDWEHVNVQLIASNEHNTYTLYDSVFTRNPAADNTMNLSLDISDTSFVDDPWGGLAIKAVVNWDGIKDDFAYAITRVGISAETNAAPVPEPATMLLLGTGLIGIAGVGRKKLKKQ